MLGILEQLTLLKRPEKTNSYHQKKSPWEDNPRTKEFDIREKEQIHELLFDNIGWILFFFYFGCWEKKTQSPGWSSFQFQQQNFGSKFVGSVWLLQHFHISQSNFPPSLKAHYVFYGIAWRKSRVWKFFRGLVIGNFSPTFRVCLSPCSRKKTCIVGNK